MLDSVTKQPQPEGMIQVGVKFPTDLIEALDAWVVELNAARGWPKVTRSDLMRGVLAWAAKERPNWEGK